MATAAERTHTELSQLFLIAGMIEQCVMLIVALTMGLLTYIYYAQRTPEFGLLAAIGYGRRRLLARVAREVSLLVMGAWAAGLALNVAALWLLWRLFMEPRGMVLDPFDASAYARTAILPGVVLLFALATVTRQVGALDPVTVIERRL
jgi:ABC-type antimicrobial peptide transport system permease subunit